MRFKQNTAYIWSLPSWEIQHTHTRTNRIYKMHWKQGLTGPRIFSRPIHDFLLWSKVLWSGAHPDAASFSCLLRHAGLWWMNSDPKYNIFHKEFSFGHPCDGSFNNVNGLFKMGDRPLRWGTDLYWLLSQAALPGQREMTEAANCCFYSGFHLASFADNP